MTSDPPSPHAPPPLRPMNLRLWIDESRLTASFKNNLTGELSPPAVRLSFDRSMLADKLEKIRAILSDISSKGIWSNLSDPLAAPGTEVTRRAFADFMSTVVSEGAALYDELSREAEFTEFLNQVERLPDDSIITVETDCALIPWEILYPLKYNRYAPEELRDDIRLERLWGYRFQFEYMLLPKRGSWRPPLDEHRNAQTFVSLNLNPTIDNDFRSRPYKPIEAHKTFFKTQLGSERGEVWDTGSDILKLLLSQTSATIIYLYCHGQCDDPFTGTGREQLLVDTGNYIEPATLNVVDNQYRGGPIIILNSCSSGAYSPLSFSNFHTKFMEKKALGVIGTTLPMPATFASAFGQRLIDGYVNENLSIGDALLRLRREMLDKLNPLGLFYALQCPYHVKARK